MIKINLPLDIDKFETLSAGQTVLLSGVIFTGRDQAHKRLFALIEEKKPLPFDLKNQTIYYAGPCPTPTGKAMGSVGPTTSYRVDVFTPTMLENGLKGMIGKGTRNQAVIDSMIKNKAVYFAAIGGAGALYAKAVKKAEVIAFPDLLSEAVHRLEIEDFPVVVAIDSKGNSIY